MDRLYVAHQGSMSQVDEIRWLVNSISKGKNIALAGQPGNGKSSALRFVADILGQEVSGRTCHQHEQEFHYLGRPKMDDKKTSYASTQFIRALKEGMILLNEESSEMPRSIQKFISTLLTDDYLDFVVLAEDGSEATLREMRDEHDWKVNDFVYTETFNPPVNGNRDRFEDSHKSRMSPFNFRDLDSLLGAYVALQRLDDNSLDLPLTERGVIYRGKGKEFTLTEKVDGTWKTTKGEDLSEEDLENQATYQFFDRTSLEDSDTKDKLIAQLEEKGEFYVKYLKFLTAIRGLVDKKSIIYDSLATESKDLMSVDSGRNERLEIVYPDQRILQEGFQEYQVWEEHLRPQEAMHEATYTMIDKMLHGSMKYRRINGGTQEDHLIAIASSIDLIPRPDDGTEEGD